MSHHLVDQEDPVDQPTLARLGSMVAQVLEEIHTAPIDTSGQDRVRVTHSRTLVEIQHRLPAKLRAELERLTGGPDAHEPVSVPELRIAHAQLVGWLQGIFAGAQFAAAIDQMTGQRPVKSH